MKILFAHQNFPAQFGGFAQWLARNGWDVTFVTAGERVSPLEGVRIVRMAPHRETTEGIHRLAKPLEKAVINGQGFARSAIALAREGYVPDLVVAHSGWGSGTFAKAVWPGTKFVSYAEWYYTFPYVDAIAPPDPNFMEDGRAFALCRNAPMLLDMAVADLIWCPSPFQAAQFPAHLSARMEVMADGIDVAAHAPDPGATPPVDLPEGAEIVTYATRGMEPHRGFPEFCRALARLQARRPNLHAIIAGEDRVAYGARLPDGDSWKKRMLAELDLDESRIHWTGLLPRAAYTRLIQSAHVHTYLTVPFVLSWSMLEAMSIGAPIVASDTPPVRDVARDGVEARLVDHRNIDALTRALDDLLENRDQARALGQAARDRILKDHDIAHLWPKRAERFRALVANG